MEPVRIPRRIDESPHFLLWSSDELAPMLIGLTIGTFVGRAITFFIIGLFLTNLYRRFRENHADGYLLHAIYWWGFMPSKAKSFKNPFIRKYLP